jgi:O-glycosyl hydrolase
MTEHYTESANDADVWPLALDVATDVHNSMVEGKFNAYVWWYIRRAYGPMKEDGSVSKRGLCLAHYSKFVRPGAERIEATKAPTAGVSVSAYKKGDSVVVVAVNTNTSPKTLTATIPGLTAGTYAKFTTSATKSLAKDGTGKVTNGTFTAYADAQSVVTWVVLPETPTGVVRSAPSSVLPGTYALRDVSGRSLGTVEATDDAQLRTRIEAQAPSTGLVFARPIEGGAVRRFHILR